MLTLKFPDRSMSLKFPRKLRKQGDELLISIPSVLRDKVKLGKVYEVKIEELEK